jgi:ABC-type multidrug transport system ATPase subunit
MQLAQAIGLDGDAMHMKSTQLSGGMQRRLSLGIAFCGEPTVLFLDEPTTGLDPETRREVWNTIDTFRADRCIILTTHSMEEADALCDRIGIMAKGQLQCIGTQLHLKNRLGSGLQLKVSLDGQKRGATGERSTSSFTLADETDRFVRDELSAGATVVNRQGRVRTYDLPRGTAKMSGVFAKMTERMGTHGVDDWGIAMTSLDEVFINVVEAAEQREKTE